MRVRAIVAASLMTFVLGCGGGSQPSTPTPASAAADAAPPETFGTPNPEDLAEMNAGKDAGAAAATAATAAAQATPPPTADECTPVGVDFEKRARPKLKDCYGEGKKKDPNLQGTVKLSVEIDTLGKVKAIKIVEKTLPDPVAQCMLKVLKATPLTEAAKCPGKSFTIPVTFPTPR